MALFQRRKIPIDAYEDEARPSWISTHLPFVFISIGVVAIAAVALVITWVISNNTPLSKLSSAVSKSFNAGCDFQIDAERNAQSLMKFDGSLKVSTQPQGVTLVYDAEMGDYTYTGAVLSHEGLSYGGAMQNDQWVISDATTGVLDFLDFYTDFQNRSFDTNALMRFLDITNQYSSREFSALMQKILSRFYSENSLTGLKITSLEDGSVEYSYTIDLYALLTLIKEEGASIFQRSTDYDDFCKKLEEGKTAIENTKCAMRFQISREGYLSAVSLSTESRTEAFSLDIVFSNFGKMTKEIPDSFYQAAQIERFEDKTSAEAESQAADETQPTESNTQQSTEAVTENPTQPSEEPQENQPEDSERVSSEEE